ncbi:MAG TPA: double-strand break repair helicase AddA [Magnetospirillaceae bacterium]|jgi:ATP-dependent helicase/nuclease subunit A
MSLRPRSATELQQRAADPNASAWVAASAGSGKTKVLTDRVLRLLLAEKRPESLLCLTFTRAAAAEMGNRLARNLSRWASTDDATLRKELTELFGSEPNEPMMRRARRLFAAVLDAPGGLAIETIHGFCQSLLRRFPLEAKVPPHFQVMEERDAAELMADARETMLARARAGVDMHLAAALAAVTAVANEETFAELMRALARERGRVAQMIARFGSLAGTTAELRRILGIGSEETEATVIAAACADNAFDVGALRGALSALNEGTKTDLKKAVAMMPFLAAGTNERPALFDDWCPAFLTKEGQPLARFCTEGVEKKMPGTKTILSAEAARLVAINDRRRAARTAAATEALLTLAGMQLGTYRAEKAQRALLDYDDLILYALRLLDESAPAWVHYKLDQGIDHVLIDEAQDTNPEQWAVVQRLTAEFFAGRGAREDGGRTIFAVGDIKQSIFGFQRADPTQFPAMRDRFAEAVPAAHARWEPVVLDTSFRSTPAVLQAIDLVFAQPAATDGVAEPGQTITHNAARVGTGGRVELWPAVEPRVMDDIPAWEPPTRRVAGDDPQKRLAKLVAARIRTMIDHERIAATGRPIKPGDILILVRRRTPFVDALVRALKALDVPVAGTDRMILTEQLAVMDLLALGNVLLLPEDDLTLAAVLKGPLIGLSEDELFTLAWNRPAHGRLWDALRSRAEAGEAPFAAAHAVLADLLALADRMPPHDLYARILTDGGKAKLLARLGVEAEDALDEFMALTLAYERLHPPSLQGFLAWVERGGEEIKRDLDIATSAVRIMTVHGAKGLEAPVVFLADTTQIPRHQGPQLFWIGERDEEIPLWAPRADDLDPVGRAARDREDQARMQEYRRLLYVALTRAADQLIVCGWKTLKASGEGCWYDLVRDGLSETAEAIEDDFLAARDETAGSTVLRLTSPQTVPVKPAAAPEFRPEAGPIPVFLRQAPELEPDPPRPLAPSRPPGSEPPVRSPFGTDEGRRYRRGRIIHRLLELLPELPVDARDDAMRRFLARDRWALDDEAQAEIVTVVTGVLAEPSFAPLFGPGSRAEVPVVGMVGRFAVSGQIDRLLVEDDHVRIVDYKSDRPPPATVDGVSPLYLRQMAAYRALLGAVYPGRRVLCALLWTDGPTLMSLPDSLLDEALSRLLQP